MNYISVAIDGPAGAGKSSISKELARRLNFIYVDTGALYRSLAYVALKENLNTKTDIDKISKLADNTTFSIKYIDGIQHLFANENDITDYIRTAEVSKGASDVSAIPHVRQSLLEIQRNMAKTSNVIMDGRDIGTVVLPNASIKIFLTASIDERAKRRYKEMTEKGIKTDFELIKSDIIYRDEQDSNRPVAPLKPAEDSILFDNSNYNFEQSVEYLYNIIKERSKNAL
ncbi:MAG: (d)CMP kinase [Clostridia bacterium]|nr:(d)CMP kinase [Clostridia bacterium]